MAFTLHKSTRKSLILRLGQLEDIVQKQNTVIQGHQKALAQILKKVFPAMQTETGIILPNKGGEYGT